MPHFIAKNMNSCHLCKSDEKRCGIWMRNSKCCTASFHLECLLFRFIDRLPQKNPRCPNCESVISIEDYTVNGRAISDTEINFFLAGLMANTEVVLSLKEKVQDLQLDNEHLNSNRQLLLQELTNRDREETEKELQQLTSLLPKKKRKK